eukprot:TRINITY_DN44261_c0_g1_i1.p1 TRINITY_DN44261_c0_g1~~TRINITY_DN44261_c0_g1_i1.p1  ORF type:complete len:443 (+),score=45.31 TRINITY_DN44261_c0_g1_i1:64-1392(+)
MPFLKCSDLRAEEAALASDTVDLRLLFYKKSPVACFVAQAFVVALQASVMFACIVAAMTAVNKLASALFVFVAVAIFAWRAAVFLVFVASVAAGKLLTRLYRKQLIYWGWWPIHTFGIVIVAVSCALLLGHYLWTRCLEPYHELAGLQTYTGVDPSVTLGARMQDGGLLEFEANVDMDRSRGGCFVGNGHTYCVAPIVHGGSVISGVGGPLTGSYDFFAVGVDCCACPNQDFRCGDWTNPLTHGGVRSIDVASRPFYRLAVDDWSATYRKAANHPLFFDWTQDPVRMWRQQWTWSRNIALLSVACTFMLVFTVTAFAGKLLHVLVSFDIASPMDTPAPPSGHKSLWAWCLTDMLHMFEEERRQMAQLPRSPIPQYPPSDGRLATQRGSAEPVSGAACRTPIVGYGSNSFERSGIPLILPHTQTHIMHSDPQASAVRIGADPL